MSKSVILLFVPYTLVALTLWHRKKKPFTFSRPPWTHITVVFVIFVCVLTLSLLSNPSSFDPKGIVPGWEPDKNLMVEAFIEEGEWSGHSNGSSICNSPLLLLIVVCSSPANHHLRMAIRLTWASLKDSSLKVVFLLGRTHDATLQDRILKENKAYNDIVQENFIDSYNNLTIKSVLMLRWFTQNCKQTNFLFKTDDDIFLDTRVLINSLKAPFPSGITPENFLGGSVIRGARPVKDNTNKWFMPSYLYTGVLYPHYISGTAYLMSYHVAERLYNASLRVKMIHMEDIFITGLCAQEARIKPIMLFGFTYKRIKPFTCDTRFFMSHRVTPGNIFDLWVRHSACTKPYVESIFQHMRNGIWQKVENQLQLENR